MLNINGKLDLLAHPVAADLPKSTFICEEMRVMWNFWEAPGLKNGAEVGIEPTRAQGPLDFESITEKQKKKRIYNHLK